MAKLVVSWIGWWCNNGSERAWRSNSNGMVAQCSALLWRGRERAGCEGEMEQAAEARSLSLYISLTGWASASIQLPRGMPSLPLVGH